MRTIMVWTAVLAAALGGCAAKKTPTATPPKAPVTLAGTVNEAGSSDISGAGANTSVAVEQRDFAFAPTYIKAAPGAVVKIKVTNGGTVSHTFTIDAPSVDKTITAGASDDVTVTLPASGVVSFYCRFHRGSGMQGAFYFAAGGAAGSPSGSTTPASGGSKGYGY